MISSRTLLATAAAAGLVATGDAFMPASAGAGLRVRVPPFHLLGPGPGPKFGMILAEATLAEGPVDAQAARAVPPTPHAPEQ